MGLFDRLFGTEKALTDSIKSVSKGLDALIYTDEEKERDAAKDRTEARKMVVEWMKATQGQNLARRLIALSITFVWLLQYVLAQLFNVLIPFLPDLKGLNDLMLQGANNMNSAVMLILAFYFAAPHMGDIVKTLKK